MTVFKFIFIFVGVVLLLWVGRQIIQTLLVNRWTDLWHTQDMYYAIKTANLWISEGKLESMNMGKAMDHLSCVCRGDVDTLRLISGSHGYAVYKALLSKRKWYNFH